LDDPRIVLPVAVYRGAERAPPLRSGGVPGEIAFFAPERSAPGLLAIGPAAARDEPLRVLETDSDLDPIFYALPAEVKPAPHGTALLFAWRNGQDALWYGVEGSTPPAGYRRDPQALGRVWNSPLSFPLRP
jgi:hypothetical protein